jgi:hypothetical protein
MLETVAKPAGTTITPTRDTAETPTSIEVVLSFRVDLRLLRRQKRVLIDIRHNPKVSPARRRSFPRCLSYSRRRLSHIHP